MPALIGKEAAVMQSDLWMVPVPGNLVVKVMEFVVREQGGEPVVPARGEAPPSDETDPEEDTAISPDMYHDHVARESWAEWADMPPADVARAYLDSKPGGSHRELLEFLAEHPDERMEYKEVANSLGWSRQALNGTLGTYGRRANSRYNERRPWHIYKDPSGTWWMWMDSEQADIIRDLASVGTPGAP
jgi:hypothetical protein